MTNGSYSDLEKVTLSSVKNSTWTNLEAPATLFCRRNFRKTFLCYLATPPADLLHWTPRLPGIGNRTSDSYMFYHRSSLGSPFSDALGHHHFSTSRTELSYPPSQERLLPGCSSLMSPALASSIHCPGNLLPNYSRQLFRTAPVSLRLVPRTGTQELPPSSGFPNAGFSKTLFRLIITDSQDWVFNTDSSRLTLPDWLPRLTVPNDVPQLAPKTDCVLVPRNP